MIRGIPKIINHQITHRGLCPRPENPERVYYTKLFVKLFFGGGEYLNR